MNDPLHYRRLYLRGIALVGILTGLSGICLLLARFWPQYAIHPPLPDRLPLKADLDVHVWAPDIKRKSLLIGEDPVLLPLRENDRAWIEVRLNRPAYSYLLWIDGKGKVFPLYPWNVSSIDHESAATIPPLRCEFGFRSPPEDQGWVLDDTEGLETILLLVRREPWPVNRNLAELIGELRPFPVANPHEVVKRGWARGKPVVDSPRLHRAGWEAEGLAQIDDPLLKLIARLANDFEVIRTVQFAHAAKH